MYLQNIKKFVEQYVSLYILMLFIIFITYDVIFSKDGRLFFIDLQIPLDVETTFNKYMYTWYYANGWGNYVFPFLSIQILFHLILSKLNISLIEKNILITSFIGGVISYYLFIRDIITNSEKSKSIPFNIAFLSSGMYFLFNAEIIRRLYQPGFFKGYLFIPLFLYLFMKSFSKNTLADKYLIGIILMFPLIFASSPHYFIYYMIILAICCFFAFITTKHRQLIILKSGLTFCAIFLISSYFMLPFILFPNSPTQSGFYIFKTDIARSESLWNANILKHLTLTVGWINLSDTFNIDLINNNLWLTLGSILFLMGISTILYPKKTLKMYIKYDRLILILILFVASFILYLGYFLPLSGIIYDKIIFNSPIDWVFRVITRIGGIVAFSLSVLIFIFIYLTLQTLKNRGIKCFISIISLITVIMYTIPMQTYAFDRYIINDKLPEDYLIIFDILKYKTDNIFSLPLKDPFNMNFIPVWTTKRIGLPLENSLPTVLTHVKEKDRYFSRVIVNELESNRSTILNYFIETYDIRHIILHKDLNYNINNIYYTLSRLPYKKQYIGKYINLYEVSSTSDKFYIKNPIVYTVSTDIYDYTPFIYINNTPIVTSHYQKAKYYLIPVDINEFKLKILMNNNVIDSKQILRVLFDSKNVKEGYKSGWGNFFHKSNEAEIFPKMTIADFDSYFIFTNKKNSTISKMFKVDNPGAYQLFIRYLKSNDGGTIIVHINNRSIYISTKDQLNKFITENFGIFYLKEGLNKIVIKNVDGFNAVNSFIFIKYDKANEYLRNIKYSIQNKNVIYILEAERDLYRENAFINNNENFSNGMYIILGDSKIWQNIKIIKNGSYKIGLKGIGAFKVYIINNNSDDRPILLKSKNLDFTYSNKIYLSEGTYIIKIMPIKIKNYVNNPSFEQEFAGLPVNWDLGNSNFKIGFDKGYDGSRSLKVSTSSTVKAWSFIRSEPIEVTPGEDYLIITHMKYYNVKGSHIKVEAYYPDGGKSGTWKQLTPFIPGGKSGTSNWQEYSAIIRIPENVTKIRVVLNAGWVLDKSKGEAITWFDDIQVIPVAEAPKLDVVWLYSTDDNKTIEQLFETKETPAKVISYTKVNPTLWKVKVNASKPFMLSFAEAYDPLWEARVYKDGEKVEVVRSIPLYSVINGFWINETGELEVVIRYKPQDWFEIGLAISALTFIACIGYLFYDWRRGKN